MGELEGFNKQNRVCRLFLLDIKMKNQDYIDKYRFDTVIIANTYSDDSGKMLDGIVSPLKIDNRQTFSPIDFQEDSPHCAGYAAANLCESIIWKKTGKLVQLDAHQIYAKAKEIDGAPKIEGTYPEHALKAALGLGVFGDRKYSVRSFSSSKNKNAISYMKHLVHLHDFLLGGFVIRENWTYCTSSRYVIDESTEKVLGGHAVCIVGYNKTGVIIANSWSPRWGAKGFAIVSWKAFLKDFLYCSYLVES